MGAVSCKRMFSHKGDRDIQIHLVVYRFLIVRSSARVMILFLGLTK